MGRKMNFFLNALLVLLFGMGLSSCSYASISEDYIYYSLENGNFDGVYTGQVSKNQYSTLKDNIDITELITLLTNDIENLGYLNPSDYNISCFFDYYDFYAYYSINFVFHNNSRNTYNNLGYLEIKLENATYNAYLKSHNEEPVYILSYLYNLNFDYVKNDIETVTTNRKIGNFNNVKTYTIENLQDLSIFNQNIFTTTNLSEYFINYPRNSTTVYSARLKINNSWYELLNSEPEEPEDSGDSGGGIIWPSGETTPPDLSGIAGGIDNINSTILDSAQNIVQNDNKNTDKIIQNQNNNTQKIEDTLTDVPNLSDTFITSGEITNALNFDFAEDPYSNFWLQLTTGLSGALTNNVRSIDVQFRGETYKIELDKFALQTPEFLRSFLAILFTVFIFWKMVKYWKIIIDNITSGNMDEVLEMNEEERNY